MPSSVVVLTRRKVLAGLAVSAFATATGHAAKASAVRTVTVLPVKPAELTEFLPVMKESARVARERSDNQAFCVFMDKESPATLYVFESWDSLPDLADFMKTDAQQALASLEQSALSGESLSLHLSDVANAPAYESRPFSSTEDAQTMLVRFQVRPQDRAAFIAALHDVIPLARADRNNEAYDLFHVGGRPDNFVLLGRWKNAQSYEKHQRLPYVKRLHQILPAMLIHPSERHELGDVVF